LTTLLAVDDSVTMRKVLEITFAGEDYRLLSADGGDAALEVVRRDKPDIVLLDISLPGKDGYAICAEVKAAHPKAFVVLMSSKQVAYDAAKGSSVGADDFADKPFDTTQFIEKVRKVLAGTPVALPAGAAPAPAAAPVAPVAAAAPAARPVAPPLAAPAPSPFAQTQNTLPFGSTPAQARPPAATPATSAAATTPPPVAVAPAASASRTEPSLDHLREALPPRAPAATPAPAADRTLAAMAPAVAPPRTPSSSAVQVAGATAAMSPKLQELGLTPAQVEAVLALSREVVERVVWEVVPTLAETIIKEEVRRLTAE
jgi:CheY-like chemotaxis protein